MARSWDATVDETSRRFCFLRFARAPERTEKAAAAIAQKYEIALQDSRLQRSQEYSLICAYLAHFGCSCGLFR
jgi:hypothetical protein